MQLIFKGVHVCHHNFTTNYINLICGVLGVKLMWEDNIF